MERVRRGGVIGDGPVVDVVTGWGPADGDVEGDPEDGDTGNKFLGGRPVATRTWLGWPRPWTCVRQLW